jgi:transcriptional repressor of cell division inhibition gene dicB
MKKADVKAHFGGTDSSVAKSLGITRSAVWQWGEIVPERIAYKVQIITGGALRVDPSLYEKRGERVA